MISLVLSRNSPYLFCYHAKNDFQSVRRVGTDPVVQSGFIHPELLRSRDWLQPRLTSLMTAREGCMSEVRRLRTWGNNSTKLLNNFRPVKVGFHIFSNVLCSYIVKTTENVSNSPTMFSYHVDLEHITAYFCCISKLSQEWISIFTLWLFILMHYYYYYYYYYHEEASIFLLTFKTQKHTSQNKQG